LLVPREKTKDEMEHEEEEYQEFLKREVGHDLSDLITVEPTDTKASMVLQEENEEGKKKKKKGKKERENDKINGRSKNKEDEDHQFLMK
jgi:protein KRI1